MSVETRPEPPMPFPEQWLADHPWWTFAIFVAYWVLVILVAAEGWT